jgi:tRNA(Arg) A34 adenosine deaminase TadA
MTLQIPLPDWLQKLNAEPHRFTSDREAMAFVIAAATRNIADGGGPFGAAVLNEGGELVALGVNRVIPAGTSILHAEMLALVLAQRRLGSHSFAPMGKFTLVTSCEPCAMCFGAIPFAGIARVVCGATTADAEVAGFDEGDKPSRWQDSLRARGIEVTTAVLRDEAATVLKNYSDGGGFIY